MKFYTTVSVKQENPHFMAKFCSNTDESDKIMLFQIQPRVTIPISQRSRVVQN